MKKSDEIQLSYSSIHKRIRVSFCRRSLFQDANAQKLIVARVKKKLEKEVERGDISEYLIFDQRLAKCCEALCDKETTHVKDDEFISFTIGVGIPHIPDLIISMSITHGALFDISFPRDPEITKTWNYSWVESKTLIEMKKLGKIVNPDKALLKAVFERAKNGEKINDFPIYSEVNKKVWEKHASKPYIFVPRNNNNEITLAIFEVEKFRKQSFVESFISKSKEYVNQLSGTFRFFEEDIKAVLSDSSKGVERLGLELPLSILVAIKTSEVKSELEVGKAEFSAAKHQNSSKAVVDETPKSDIGSNHGGHNAEPDGVKYPGKGFLKVSISDDKMKAVVKGFIPSFFRNKSLDISPQWLEKEMKRLGLVYEPESPQCTEIINCILNKEDINGKIVALGKFGTSGGRPVLKEVKREQRVSAAGNVDMRESKVAGFANAGDLVAQIEVPGSEPSVDVFGNESFAVDVEDFEVTMGPGIRRSGNKFYSTESGIVSIGDRKIEMRRNYVHKGDVNLISGDIIFDGTVHIHGHVDTNATVEVSGDLVIYGSIRDGVVKCGGDLTVKSGILTTQKGSVSCNGDINATFIENSRIFCLGNIKVKKAILSSRIYCNGGIIATSTNGLVSGGEIYVKKFLRVTQLGFESGAPTTIHLGSDFRYERKVHVARKHLEQVEEKSKADRLKLREITKIPAAKLTDEQKDAKVLLQNRLQRARKLIEELKLSLMTIESKRRLDMNCYVRVEAGAFSTVQFMAEDTAIPCPGYLSGCAIVLRSGGRIAFITPAELNQLLKERAKFSDDDSHKLAG